MVATVKTFENTGLTPSNCMDSLAKLSNFTSHSFSNIAVKQDRGLILVRINTSWNTIKDSDYAIINDTSGYWIIGITMINENVAELSLQQDYLTTVGISGLSVVSGWCTRRHVSNDTLYANTIDEPFVPTGKLLIDKGIVICDDTAGFEPVVLSSVDLTQVSNTAEAYFDSQADKVLVPQLPLVQGQTTSYVSHLVSPAKTANIALSNAFSPDVQIVLDGVQRVRQLGVESCIGAAYMLPKCWATVTKDANGVITNITDKYADYTSAFGNTWGTYKNNKVYSGQFQKIQCFSMCTGDSITERVEDIINIGGPTITWKTFADTRYSGAPGCKPATWHGTANSGQFEVVTGANWQKTPFCYNIGSGWGMEAAQYGLNNTQNWLNIGNSIADLILNLGQVGSDMVLAGDQGLEAQFNSVLNTGRTGTGFAKDLGKFLMTRKQMFSSLNRNMMQGAEDVKFPQTPMMADYIGNGFYEIRYRLSDNDMQRFDDYLSSFGYAVDEVLTEGCFTGRSKHNYVKGDDVSLKKVNVPKYLLAGAEKQIEAGVRIWHVAPSRANLLNNPIAS